MSDDGRPVLYVHADHSPDEVRKFFEVPDAVVRRIRPKGDPRTFVQALADLLVAAGGSAHGWPEGPV